MSKKLKRKDEWTRDEVQFLKENYATATGSEIASVLGRSKAAVYTKASILDLNKPEFLKKKVQNKRAEIIKLNSSAPKWTKRQVLFLKENTGKLSDKEISEKIGKSIPAIYCKRRSLKIVKNVKALSNEEKIISSTENRFKAWSKKDEKTLKAKFNSVPVEELASELKRTVASLNSRARSLGLLVPTKSNVTRASWSEEEISYVKKNVNKKSLEEMSDYLGRSVASIQCKMTSLKIRKAFPMRKKNSVNLKKVAIAASIVANIGLVACLLMILL